LEYYPDPQKSDDATELARAEINAINAKIDAKKKRNSIS